MSHDASLRFFFFCLQNTCSLQHSTNHSTRNWCFFFSTGIWHVTCAKTGARRLLLGRDRMELWSSRHTLGWLQPGQQPTEKKIKKAEEEEEERSRKKDRIAPHHPDALHNAREKYNAKLKGARAVGGAMAGVGLKSRPLTERRRLRAHGTRRRLVVLRFRSFFFASLFGRL